MENGAEILRANHVCFFFVFHHFYSFFSSVYLFAFLLYWQWWNDDFMYKKMGSECLINFGRCHTCLQHWYNRWNLQFCVQHSAECFNNMLYLATNNMQSIIVQQHKDLLEKKTKKGHIKWSCWFFLSGEQVNFERLLYQLHNSNNNE